MGPAARPAGLNTQMPRYVIDRFEDDGWAVLEDDRAHTFSVPKSWLPITCREGDVLNVSEVDAEGDVRALRVQVDPAATQARRVNADRLRSTLPQGPKGDISL